MDIGSLAARCVGTLVLLVADAASANDALASKSGCLSCHAKSSKLVGPSYHAVAERYRGNRDAAKDVARHIRAGGVGRWGETPMPPQPHLNDADVQRLAAWILAGAK